MLNQIQISEKINKKLLILQKNKKNKDYWNITWRLGDILSEIIRINQPNRILEIGTSNGFSTLWIAKELNLNSKIYTVEINKERFEFAKKIFEECSINNIISINDNILNIINENTFEEKFEFIFLDAAQKEYKNIILKLEEKKLISKKCTIVADNVLSHEYMEEFIEFMREKYFCEMINFDSGFLIAMQK